MTLTHFCTAAGGYEAEPAATGNWRNVGDLWKSWRAWV